METYENGNLNNFFEENLQLICNSNSQDGVSWIPIPLNNYMLLNDTIKKRKIENKYLKKQLKQSPTSKNDRNIE